MDHITPATFAEESFAVLNRECFDAYVDYRIKGVHDAKAFTMLFGADDDVRIKCVMMEHNPYFQREYARKLAAKKPLEMWNEKMAVQQWLQLLNDPFTKCSTKATAAKELSVLMGITSIDDAGRTVSRRKLSDFYSSEPVSSDID